MDLNKRLPALLNGGQSGCPDGFGSAKSSALAADGFC